MCFIRKWVRHPIPAFVVYGSLVIVGVVVRPVGLAAQQSFDEWDVQQREAFRAFVTQEDAAFAEFLSSEWAQFQSFLETGFYAQPKLESPPRTDTATQLPPDILGRIGRNVPQPQHWVRDGSIQPTRIIVSYHGIKIPIAQDTTVDQVHLEARSPEGFSRYWEAMVLAGGDRLATAIDDAAEASDLNDYSKFRLITVVAEHLFDSDVQRAAATWFLMVKNDYDMRIAYNDTEVALLLPSTNILYDTAYFTIENRRYYLLRSDANPFRERQSWLTYEAGFPGSDKTVRLELPDEVGVPTRMRPERLAFTYRDREYTIEVPVNEYIVEYLADYPFTDWWVHFFPPTTESTRRALVSQLGRAVSGRTPAEAANVLLRFVQTAFPYETDQEHFGVEKWQAPEEILYYRRSDCDDRSIFYAYLVREVLGWDDVAMLRYPGHLAVAVPQRRVGISGDSVRVNGETYIVTDPTYIGADIGMAIPRYRNVRPEANIIERRQ